MGKGIMRIWAIMLLYEISAQGIEIEKARRRADHYAGRDDLIYVVYLGCSRLPKDLEKF